MPGPGMGMGPRGFLTDEEKANAPKVSKGLIKRIFSYLKPYRLQFFLVFVTIILAAIVGLLPSIITGRIVDEALVGRNMELLIKLLIYALIALVGSQLIGLLENYINTWISQKVIFDMKNQMYEHLEYMPHSFYTTEKPGDIITRMNTDINGVSSVISNTLTSIVSNIATIVTTVVALFSMSWQLALVGILVLPFLILPTKAAGQKRFTLLSQSQAKNDEINQIINETLSVSGSLLIKLFTREKKEYDKFVKVNKEGTDLSLKESRSGRAFWATLGIFIQLGPLLIYFAGGLIIIKNIDPALTVGTVTAMVALINRLYRPVESLLNIHVDFTRSLALFTRIFDYLDREITIKTPDNPQKPEVVNQPIIYDHVKFGYNPADPESIILKDISFTVPGGKMYAVVGPSGSGKSTLVNLIPRLYDVLGGSVKIAGVDVRDFDLEYLRQNIGVVTQDTYLFNGTIRENLLYAKDNATQEELEEACKIANIHDYIAAQPDGYETIVGNRGLKLSGGEKQRISIARVILKNPAILILDEATSALDSISENAIQDALESLMAGRTSIVIAHRLSTILKADNILVIKDGIIKEQGSHDELLAVDGVYKELYETQFRPALEYEEERSKHNFNIETLSSEYTVRNITEAEISDVYRLCKGNRRYYEILGEEPSIKELTDVITEMPGGTGPENKHFVGFYKDTETITDESGNVSKVGGQLIAILDLITGYPEKDDAFIGWFMVDAEIQNQGIGSRLFADIRAAMKGLGFDYLSLGCFKENIEALAFWESQGFRKSEREAESHGLEIYVLERDI